MSEQRIADRYAKSLIDLSMEQKILEDILRDISVFAKTYEENRSLQTMLKSPIVQGDKKSATLKKLFPSFHKNTQAFFDILIRKRREYYLYHVARAFIEQYKEVNNIITANVTTAIPLDDQTASHVREFIEKAIGKKVTLNFKVDATLIGGLVIQINDRLFDASIASKLNKAKKELLNAYISK